MCLSIRDPDYHSELISFIGRGQTDLYLFRLQHVTLYHLLDCGEMVLAHTHGMYFYLFIFRSTFY